MPNAICDACLIHFKNSVAQKLRSVNWIIEQHEPFVGFGYSAEVLYSCGTTRDGRRAGIVDSRVMFKFATGSRHIVRFPSVQEALEFWNKHVGLPTFKVKPTTIHNESIVKVLKDTHNLYLNNGIFGKVEGQIIGHIGKVIGTISPSGLIQIECKIKIEASQGQLITQDHIMLPSEDLEIIKLAPPQAPIIPRGSIVKIVGDSLKRYGDNLSKDMNKSILGLEGVVTENLSKIGSRLVSVNLEKHTDLLFSLGKKCITWPTGWCPVVQVNLLPDDLEILKVGVY